MWLSDHNWGARNAERRKNKSLQYRFLVVWNYFLIVGGSFITVSSAGLVLLNFTDSLSLHRWLEPYVSLAPSFRSLLSPRLTRLRLLQYGSIVGIINDYSGKALTAFSCADNS